VLLHVRKIEGPLEIATRYHPVEISLPSGPGYRFQLTSKKGLKKIQGPEGGLGRSDGKEPLTLDLPGYPVVPITVDNHKGPITIKIRAE
jgi:hypothetical protein